MRRTTRIELLLRLLGIVGVLLIIYGTLYQPGPYLSPAVAGLGLFALLLAVAGAFGSGPIGQKLRNLYSEEKKQESEKYKRASQPWETKR